MKFSLLTAALLLACQFSFAQANENFVKFYLTEAVFNDVTTKSNELVRINADVTAAFMKDDNFAVGESKSALVKIVHTLPSTMNNISNIAIGVKADPDFQSSKQGLVFEQFEAEMDGLDGYVEVELLEEEVFLLRKAANKISVLKTALKNSNYAIHPSQKRDGATENIKHLGDFSDSLAEAIEIITIGTHR